MISATIHGKIHLGKPCQTILGLIRATMIQITLHLGLECQTISMIYKRATFLLKFHLILLLQTGLKILGQTTLSLTLRIRMRMIHTMTKITSNHHILTPLVASTSSPMTKTPLTTILHLKKRRVPFQPTQPRVLLPHRTPWPCPSSTSTSRGPSLQSPLRERPTSPWTSTHWKRTSCRWTKTLSWKQVVWLWVTMTTKISKKSTLLRRFLLRRKSMTILILAKKKVMIISKVGAIGGMESDSYQLYRRTHPPSYTLEATS